MIDEAGSLFNPDLDGDQAHEEPKLVQEETNGEAARQTPYLETLKIDAFGKFAKETVGPFSPGLNIALGKNEAGKSTTKSFIAQVLYGWETARGKAPTYKPDGTGKRSGSLFFASNDGEWELVRDEGSKKEGKTITHRGPFWDDAFADITAGVDELTYKNVFSFDANELQHLTADSSQITSKLVTAQSATPVAPTDALEAIENTLKEYTSKSLDEKKAPRSIPRITTEIQAMRDEEASLKTQSRDAFEQMDEARALEEERAAVEQERNELLSASRNAEGQKLRAQELYSQLQDLQNDLDDSVAAQAVRAAERDTIELETALLDAGDDLIVLNSKVDEQKRAASTIGELSRQEAELAAQAASMPKPSCSSDATLASNLDEASSRRERLAAKLETAQSACEEALREKAMLDAKIQSLKQTQEAAGTQGVHGAASSSARLYQIAALVLLVIGVVAVALNAGGAVGNAAVLWAGIGCVVVAAVLLVLATVGTTRPSGETQAAESDALRSLVHEAESAAGRLAGAEHDVQAAAAALAQFDAEQQEWFVRHGFAQVGEQASISQAKAQLEQKRAYDQAVTVLAEKSRALANERDRFAAWADRARSVLEPLGIAIADASDEALFVHIESAYRRFEAQRDLATQAAQLDSQSKVAQAEIDTQRKRALSKAAELAQILGVPEGESLTSATVSEKLLLLEDRTNDLAAREEELRIRSGELGDAIAEISALLGQAETDRSLADLQMRLNEKEAVRDRWIEEYLELRIAAQMLQDTIVTWREEEQPKIYQRASELFAQMTDDRWTAVRPGDDKADLYAIDSAKNRVATNRLSTSTVQLLYLAIRLALLESNPETGAPLPIVMDDAFVHLDERRSEGVARAIAQFAQSRQVILFTFDEQLRDLFTHHAQTVHEVSL